MAPGGRDRLVDAFSFHSFPRDLLKRFSGTGFDGEENRSATGGAATEETEDLELSLGLSLGGRFGSENKEKGLFRSSSIASLSVLPYESGDKVVREGPQPLARAFSLPAEIDEEHRKRKEIQSLNRLEAKRKRSEKRNSKNDVPSSEDSESPRKSRRFAADLNYVGGGAGGRNGALPANLPGWAVITSEGTASTTGPHASEVSKTFGLISNGSVGSQGSRSSDSGSQSAPGLETIPRLSSSSSEAKSPSRSASLFNADVNNCSGVKSSATAAAAAAREMERSMMEEMPCVWAKGEGPDGRSVQGFLYKFRRGEEVRIVCVCHGRFLTPAEFVKHAGGGDVAHPLKHIVVNPSPAAF